jgi:Arc/MetJ-type ribon-helix-helix transcriptional regulator
MRIIYILCYSYMTNKCSVMCGKIEKAISKSMLAKKKRYRKPISVTIDPRMVEWLDDLVSKRFFVNRSDGVDFCIILAKAELEKSIKKKWWYRVAVQEGRDKEAQ